MSIAPEHREGLPRFPILRNQHADLAVGTINMGIGLAEGAVEIFPPAHQVGEGIVRGGIPYESGLPLID